MNLEHLRKIAHLSRLELSEEEEQKLLPSLNNILLWMDKLNEIDTTGVEPLIMMTEEINIKREDEVKQDFTREQVLKNAPQTDGEFFIVPKVIE